MLTGAPSLLKAKPAQDSADQVAKYIAMLEAMLAESKAECEHECEEKDKEREARLQAEMAATTATANATAERARADAAERALSSETRRADECDRMHKACMADCEQLRTKLISEVESRSKAEGALAGMREAAGRPAPPLSAPSKGKVRYDVRRGQTGEIVSIDATPEG